jgi:predicted RNA-binding Zn-ribbon protein involved in translation (DUF1610 family)
MADKIVCTSCGYIGQPKTITKGSIFIEIILWLCFLIPGLVYSVWRLSSRYQGCPSCGQTTIIPQASPMAQKFLRENFSEKHAADTGINRYPSEAATSMGKAVGRFVGRVLK